MAVTVIKTTSAKKGRAKKLANSRPCNADLGNSRTTKRLNKARKCSVKSSVGNLRRWIGIWSRDGRFLLYTRAANPMALLTSFGGAGGLVRLAIRHRAGRPEIPGEHRRRGRRGRE